MNMVMTEKSGHHFAVYTPRVVPFFIQTLRQLLMRNRKRTIMNYEFWRMWKDTVVAYFKNFETHKVPGSRLGQFIWDMWWTTWHWDRYFLRVLRFSSVNIIPSWLHAHVSSERWTTGPVVAAVQRDSLTPSTRTTWKLWKPWKIGVRLAEIPDHYKNDEGLLDVATRLTVSSAMDIRLITYESERIWKEIVTAHLTSAKLLK
jgi:hypothetical protein